MGDVRLAAARKQAIQLSLLEGVDEVGRVDAQARDVVAPPEHAQRRAQLETAGAPAAQLKESVETWRG